MAIIRSLMSAPQRLGVFAAIIATGLGMVYMAAAGAPSRYLVVNGAALVIGLALLAMLPRRRDGAARGGGWLVVAAAAGLLATAVFGVQTDGTARWVRVGVVSLQPSLMLLPLMILAFARDRDRKGTLGLALAALALALQPDRALAATLVAGLAAILLARREPRVLLALAAAVAGLAVTLLRADTLPPSAFVEQVFADAFASSALTGWAVVVGGLALLLPALARFDDAVVFGAVWLSILLAAVVANYPTPLVGYGGSAIIGYLLCLAALPSRAGRRGPADRPTTTATRSERDRHERVAAAWAR